MLKFISGFFKRTKIEPWELELLKHVINQLPAEYRKLQDAIDEGLYRSVLVGIGDIPGYVAFTYHSDLLKKFEDKKEPDYRITGLKVWDTTSGQFLPYTFYVSNGHVNGYAIEARGKFRVDLSKTDVSNYRKVLSGNKYLEEIKKLLTSEEMQLIEPSEVYGVFLEGKYYFHLKSLEDGDFIGLDEERKIYKITHDPFKIRLLEGSLTKALKEFVD